MSLFTEELVALLKEIPKEAGAAAAAFHRHYQVLSGDVERVVDALFSPEVLEHVTGEKTPLTEKALWLWNAGETLNRIDESHFPVNWRPYAERVAEEIEVSWRVPRPHWMIPGEPGVYLSNLALFYGAVQSVNNTQRSAELQRLLKEIRAFSFEHMLVKGSLISRLGETEPYGDIGAAAIPFALFNAGDLVLVGAVNRVEEQLADGSGIRFAAGDLRYGGCVRPDLTCLMAWYYCELGNLIRARRLLEQAEQLWRNAGKFAAVDISTARVDIERDHDLALYGEPEESYLSYTLYAIAKMKLEEKEYSGGTSVQGLSIVHMPKGSGSLYRFEACERSPRQPLAGQEVLLYMQTEPYRPEQTALVQYKTENDHRWLEQPMILETDADGEKRWAAKIGSFPFGETVTYRFAVTDSGKLSLSDEYSFSVLAWAPLGRTVGCRKTENGTDLRFAPFVAGGRSPVLTVVPMGDHTLKWTFATQETDAGEEWSGSADFASLLPAPAYDLPGAAPIECLIDREGNAYALRVQTKMSDDERWYGTGERFSAVEFRGQEVDVYVYNQYKDQGLKTYMPVPFAMSSRGYGVFADTTRESRFRFGSRLHDRFELETELHPDRPSLTLYWFTGTPKDMLQAYTSITGKPKLPPKWAFGPWMSSNNWDSQAETYRQVELTEKHDIPATVLVLEQWSDEATFYIFNDAMYTPKEGTEPFRYEDFEFPEWGRWPNPKQMVEDLHQRGLRVLLWQIPVIKFMEGIAHAQKDADERIALEHGYIIRRKNGEPYRIPHFEWFKGSLVPDFSNPEAKRWWFERRRYLLEEIGVDGFKTDGGECLYGDDLLAWDGREGDEMRNAYPNDYVEAYHEFISAFRGEDGITFSRAGYAGSQRFPMHWAGDERSTYTAFRSTVKAGLNSGWSGIPFWGWDLGGFHGDIPTAELYIRSAQMALFCPVMQYHAETKGEFNQDRTPWNIAERTGTPETIARYKRLADLRMNLLPYIYDQAIKTSRSGIPLMRAMALEYPEDPRVRTMDSQYFFGDALLVAPIMEEHATTKEIYFPEGRWFPLFGGEEVTGPRYATVHCSLDEIPVYVKQDSVVALNLPESHQLGGSVGNRIDGYERLVFYVYLADAIDYEFCDDLGNRIRLQGRRSGNALELTVDAKTTEAFTLVFHGCQSGTHAVLLDDSPAVRAEGLEQLQVGEYVQAEGSLYVGISADVKKVVVKMEG